MARSTAQITPDMVDAFKAAGIRVVQTVDGHWLAKNYDRRTGADLQRVRKMSMMRYAGRRWRMLDLPSKNAWRDFGELYGFTGYNAFTKGICASYIADGFGLGVGRLGSALFGGGASNFYSRLDTNYLSKVGHLSVGNVQSSILVRQMHPLDYIMRERASKKNHVFLFNFKEESASGTFNFGCGYNVIPDPAATNFSIELCVRTYASNNDNTGSVVATISLSNVGGWQTVSGVVDLGSSVVWGYSLDFVFTNFAGDFYFDNIVAKYLGTNFAFDNSCEIIVWNRANNWPEVQDIWAIQNVVNSTILQMERYDRILLTSGT